jgi:polyferredoxin
LKKRQRVRKALLLISFLLFPVTQFYHSPYLIIIGSAEGIIVGSFIFFILMVVFGTIFGRAACGWIMGCGGLQEMCFNVNDKRVKGGKYSRIKYLIWFPWLAVIAGAVIQYGGYKKIDPFYHIKNGISISEQWMFVIYYGTLILIVAPVLILGRRAICHYVCWMSPFMIIGRKIRNILNTPALKINAEPSKCVKCNLCTKNCPMSLNVSDMVNKNKMEDMECILCGSCIDSCRKNV